VTAGHRTSYIDLTLNSSVDFGFGSYHFQAQSTNVAGTVQVDLSSASAGGRFYSDSACQNLIPANNSKISVSIALGTSSANFFYADTVPGTVVNPTTTITAADDAAFVSGVAPSTLSLGPGASGVTAVNLTVPASTPLSFDTLTVVARSATNPVVSNSARIGLAIGIPDRDGDGVPDDRDACPDSNVAATVIIDGNNSGVQNLQVANGCTRSDLIARVGAESVNHGDFVSGVAHLTNWWVRDGSISGRDKGAIESAAARARIP